MSRRTYETLDAIRPALPWYFRWEGEDGRKSQAVYRLSVRRSPNLKSAWRFWVVVDVMDTRETAPMWRPFWSPVRAVTEQAALGKVWHVSCRLKFGLSVHLLDGKPEDVPSP